MAFNDRTAVTTKIGKYEIKTLLGEGGMARVYLAQIDYEIEGHETVAKPVVIKVPKSSAVTDPYKLKMFHREIKLAMGLNYAHIVPVFDAGVFEGLPFIAMAYVSGKDLQRIITAMAEAGRPIPHEAAVYVTLRVAYALNYAHNFERHGTLHPIIHRDVSPKNVMVDASAGVQLTDFGVAAALSVQSTATSFVGTPAYAAPEHASGEPRPESDIFGLGGMLWALLEGKPFRHDVPEQQMLSRAVRGYVPRLTRSGIPVALLTLLERMLAADPTERASLADVIVTLEGMPAHSFALREMLELATAAEARQPSAGHTGVDVPAQLQETLDVARIARDRGRTKPPVEASQTKQIPLAPPIFGEPVVEASPAPQPHRQATTAPQIAMTTSPGSADERPPVAQRGKPSVWLGLTAAALGGGLAALLLTGQPMRWFSGSEDATDDVVTNPGPPSVASPPPVTPAHSAATNLPAPPKDQPTAPKVDLATPTSPTDANAAPVSPAREQPAPQPAEPLPKKRTSPQRKASAKVVLQQGFIESAEISIDGRPHGLSQDAQRKTIQLAVGRHRFRWRTPATGRWKTKAMKVRKGCSYFVLVESDGPRTKETCSDGR